MNAPTQDFPTAPSASTTSAQNPPPPPPPPSGPPVPPPTARPVTSSPRRPWRQRLPEVVAAVGAVLVVLALAGFVSSTWALLDEYAKALALGIAAAGLTVAGLWADDRRGLHRIVPIVWATASAVTIGAVHVALVEAMPDATRIAIALAGVAGMTHAAVLWQRRTNSILMQLATAAAAVFAAGPIGTSMTDRFNPDLIPDLFRPLAGVFDPSLATDAFLIVAIAHLVIAVAWIAAGRMLPGSAAHVARVGGSALLGYAALEFNVLASPIGAAIALIIVLGYLIAGIVLDDVFLVVVGTAGALATGVKVIWSLFTGEVAVTLTIFAVGLVMLGWAYRAAQARGED